MRLKEAGEHMKSRIESLLAYRSDECVLDIDALHHWRHAKAWNAKKHVK
jgi:hypothetical protein